MSKSGWKTPETDEAKTSPMSSEKKWVEKAFIGSKRFHATTRRTPGSWGF